MKTTINKNDLMELKSLVSPQVLVKTTMEAVHILLMDKVPTWKECQKIMADPSQLKQQMDEYDTSKVTPSMKEKLKVIIERPDFTIERITCVSKASLGVFKWVMEVYSTC